MNRNLVLLVEDDEPIREILDEFLRFRGCHAALPGSTAEASPHLELESTLQHAANELRRTLADLHDASEATLRALAFVKPGRLAEAEWAEMKKCPQVGLWSDVLRRNQRGITHGKHLIPTGEAGVNG